MNKSGIILNVNEAFTIRFGYTKEDLAGKHFKLLFTEHDKAVNKPELELQQAITEGSANDENFLVNKKGKNIWVTGESVLIATKTESYILKVVHNIHAQKQLERFLLQSHEFIDTVFDSIDESALLLLDSRLRIIKTNKAFLVIFELDKPVTKESRLTDLEHPFWQRPDVKQETVSYLTMHNTKEKKFEIDLKSGKKKIINFHGKLIESIPGIERRLLIMIKEV